MTIIRNVSNRLARLPFAAPAEPKIETVGLVSASKFAAEFGRRPCVAASLTHGTPSVELIIVSTFSNPFGPTAIRLNVLPNRSSDLGSAENVVRKKGTSRRWPWGPGQSGPARCHRTRSCGYRSPTRPPAPARRADGHATVTSGADRGRHAATNDGDLKMWSWPWSS